MIREKLVPVLWLMLAAVIIGASIGFSARANATPADDMAFLTAIDRQGISYSSATNVIASGRAMCDMLDSGTTLAQALDLVRQHSALTGSDAAFLVTLSVDTYCPEHAVAAAGRVGGVLR